MKRQFRLLCLILFFAAGLVLPITAKRSEQDHADTFQLVEATIDDIHGAFDSHLLTPSQLVSMYLARIAAFDRSDLPQPLGGGAGNQPLNSFMHVNENALDDFGRQDPNDLMDDDGGRSLFGIPVILKDNIATKDMPTTAGSVALGGSRPEKDAFIARKLRHAGAIILGKGTLTEFANFIAVGMPTGFSSQAPTWRRWATVSTRTTLASIRGRTPRSATAGRCSRPAAPVRGQESR